ncbi:fibrinogen-like protein 1 [Haliotis rufescens]|uniref:fibrinogen-like protein 1 n=1 Tax=Haliotis rufescens TaxID=6454 RepID=UPI00201EE112|nr:fibrinogen-like protein 1 [Haliotis rufescens]
MDVLHAMLIVGHFLAVLLTPAMCAIKTDNYQVLTSCPGQIMKSGYISLIIRDVTKLDCGRKCSESDFCKSFHYGSLSRMCHLNTDFDQGDCSKMDITSEMVYYVKAQQCANGGILQPDSSCQCLNGYVGTWCERIMTDCSEGYAAGYSDGYYNIQPTSSSTGFAVRCVMKVGGRTIVHYRFETPTATLDFNRSWADYRDGFGLTNNDHWLGLEKIYHICKPGTCTLKIELRFVDDSYKQQYYENFFLSNEGDDYRMYFAKTRGKSGATLGDCLTPLNASAFSTYDRDNDNDAGSCAVEYESGFWFNACADCNPNGRLLRPADEKRTNVPSEVFWTNDLGDMVPNRLLMWLVVT